MRGMGGWLGLAGMLLLVGCAEVRTTVTARYGEQRAFKGMTFTVGMLDGARAATPWAQAQAGLIGACLEAHGLKRVPAGSDADALVLFDCAIDGGETITSGRWVHVPAITQTLPAIPPMVARPAVPSARGWGNLPMPPIMARAPFPMGGQVVVVTPATMKYEMRSTTTYTGTFTLAIHHPASAQGEKIYELTAVSKGPVANLERVSKAVFEGVLKGFPQENGKPVVIETRVR